MQQINFPFGPHMVAREGGLFFVFEMANSHQGDVEHGLKIIRSVAEIARSRGINGSIKFQFRELDTFLHPGFNNSQLPVSSNRHAKRFIETRLPYEAYEVMAKEALRFDLVPIATPFDEASVDWCESLDFPVIKIASCSSNDWPLIRRIAEAGRPVICSTGGATLREVDDVVAFFRQRQIPLVVNHCIGIYPVARHELQMDQVRQLRERYPELVVGYSAHEGSTDLDAVTFAVASGAALLERHVAIPIETAPINAYSLAPADLEAWVGKALDAHAVVGAGKQRGYPEVESIAMGELRRGIYVNKAKKAGEFLEPEDLQLNMPCLPGQFHAGHLDEVIGLPVPRGGIAPMMPVMSSSNAVVPPEIVSASIVEQTNAMLAEARIVLPEGTSAEISHQYGLNKFDEFGAVIIDIVNREYGKKLIVQMPGQLHPHHMHVEKEETFQVLIGELRADVDGKEILLKPGEKITIERGAAHAFGTSIGMIMEEISTTHIKGDSYYDDESILSDPDARKTVVVL